MTKADSTQKHDCYNYKMAIWQVIFISEKKNVHAVCSEFLMYITVNEIYSSISTVLDSYHY